MTVCYIIDNITPFVSPYVSELTTKLVASRRKTMANDGAEVSLGEVPSALEKSLRWIVAEYRLLDGKDFPTSTRNSRNDCRRSLMKYSESRRTRLTSNFS